MTVQEGWEEAATLQVGLKFTLSFLVGERTDDCSGRRMGGGSSSTS